MRLPQTLKQAQNEIEDLAAILIQAREKVTQLESDLDDAQRTAKDQSDTIDALKDQLDDAGVQTEHEFLVSEFNRAKRDVLAVPDE